MEIYALEMRQLPDFCHPNNEIRPLSRHPVDIWNFNIHFFFLLIPVVHTKDQLQ